MRTFVAVCFSDDTKSALESICTELKKRSIKGSYTRRDNFHLTLAFLGEVAEPRIADVEDSLRSLSVSPFKMRLDGIGKFKGRGGDTYWLGIDKSQQLIELYRQLSDNLISKGFILDKRPFKPHVTLGRRVRTKLSVDEFSLPWIEESVTEIHLMLSSRVDGLLTYTPIFTHKL